MLTALHFSAFQLNCDEAFSTFDFEFNLRRYMMDGGHENSAINLRREFIYPANIVELFLKYQAGAKKAKIKRNARAKRPA